MNVVTKPSAARERRQPPPPHPPRYPRHPRSRPPTSANWWLRRSLPAHSLFRRTTETTPRTSCLPFSSAAKSACARCRLFRTSPSSTAGPPFGVMPYPVCARPAPSTRTSLRPSTGKTIPTFSPPCASRNDTAPRPSLHASPSRTRNVQVCGPNPDLGRPTRDVCYRCAPAASPFATPSRTCSRV